MGNVNVLALEAARLFGLEEAVYLFVIHAAVSPKSLAEPSSLEIGGAQSALDQFVGASITLTTGWVAPEPASSVPPAIAELVCVPDGQQFLGEPG